MKRKAVYTLVPVGLLDTSVPRLMDLAGSEVQIIQPTGCPPNGSMNMTYVQMAESGEFIGLVNEASLVKTGRTAPFRDLAAEARDKRSVTR